jgi:flagellar basal-body rod protein FlgC
MSLFSLFQISGTALTAERLRAEVVTSNLANSETTRTPEGGPYQRRMVVFRSQPASSFHLLLAGSLAASSRAPAAGVEVSQVVADPAPALRRYEPGHPDADKDGYVAYPDINPVQDEEASNLLLYQRAYQAAAEAISTVNQMLETAINMKAS